MKIIPPKSDIFLYAYYTIIINDVIKMKIDIMEGLKGEAVLYFSYTHDSELAPILLALDLPENRYPDISDNDLAKRLLDNEFINPEEYLELILLINSVKGVK